MSEAPGVRINGSSNYGVEGPHTKPDDLKQLLAEAKEGLVYLAVYQ